MTYLCGQKILKLYQPNERAQQAQNNLVRSFCSLDLDCITDYYIVLIHFFLTHQTPTRKAQCHVP
jgi:hypothetical protein